MMHHNGLPVPCPVLPHPLGHQDRLHSWRESPAHAQSSQCLASVCVANMQSTGQCQHGGSAPVSSIVCMLSVGKPTGRCAAGMAPCLQQPSSSHMACTSHTSGFKLPAKNSAVPQLHPSRVMVGPCFQPSAAPSEGRHHVPVHEQRYKQGCRTGMSYQDVMQ